MVLSTILTHFNRQIESRATLFSRYRIYRLTRRCGSKRTENIILCVHHIALIPSSYDLVQIIFVEGSLGRPLGLSRGLCVKILVSNTGQIRVLVSKQGSDIDRLGVLTSIALVHGTG